MAWPEAPHRSRLDDAPIPGPGPDHRRHRTLEANGGQGLHAHVMLQFTSAIDRSSRFFTFDEIVLISFFVDDTFAPFFSFSFSTAAAMTEPNTEPFRSFVAGESGGGQTAYSGTTPPASSLPLSSAARPHRALCCLPSGLAT